MGCPTSTCIVSALALHTSKTLQVQEAAGNHVRFPNCSQACHCEAPGSALLSGPACCAIALDTCSSTCGCRMLCRQVMTSLWPNLGAPPCDVPSCHSNPSLLDSNPSLLAYNTPEQSQNIPNIFMALDLILPYPATPFSNSRYGLARPD